MNENNQQPKIQIDSDWKAQAHQEKQRVEAELKAKEAEAAQVKEQQAASGGQGAGGPASQQMPPANFKTLVSTMITQTLMSMGAMPDPMTGRRAAMLDLARHHIDMLGVLEEKTKGNLSDEDSKMLSTSLYELRMQYVQLAKQATQNITGAPQAPNQPSGAGPGLQI